jgi:transposase
MGDFLTAPRGELISLIYELIEENKALRSQIVELQAGKKEPAQEKQAPSFVKANVKRKRKKQRKQREHNFGRAKDVPTQQVIHTCEVCPDCSGFLGKPSVAYTRQVVDIPLPQKEVIEHVVYKRWCFNCGKRVYPKLNLQGMVVGKKRIGVNTMSLVDLLREQMILPLNKIQQYLTLAYNLRLSEGALVGMLHKSADMGKKDYANIKQEIRKAEVVYADETGGRENGINGYHWGFMNKQWKFMVYRKSRASTVVTEVLGKEGDEDAFTGTLVTDFYAAYNIYEGFHQRCEVHLGRAIKELKEKNPKDKQLKRWAKQVMDIFHEAKAYGGHDKNLPIGLQAQERIEKEAYYKDRLRKISEPYITKKDVPQSILCSRIIKHLSELFTFVRFPNVEPDNNRAERGMRQLVIARKISGGTRSAKGSETKSILASLFGTWRLQGLNPLEQTRLLLLRSP